MSVVFAPTGATVNVAAPAATSESVALTGLTGIAGGVVRVYNATDVLQFVEFGAGSATAVAASSLPIASGAVEYIEVGPSITHAAAIESATSEGAIYFTSGQAR